MTHAPQITGIGPVTATGIGVEEWLEAWREGVGGIDVATLFEAADGGGTLAAEVDPEFAVDAYLRTPKTYLDRVSELAFAAMALAVADGGFEPETWARERTGLMMGTALGNHDTATLFYEGFVKKGPRFVKPILFPHTYANTTISLLAMEYGIEGPHMSMASGGVASAQALAAACDAIRFGRADTVFAGGVEGLGQALYESCHLQGLLSTPAGEAGEECLPFDRRRNGFVLGEGSAVLALESAASARSRGARVYAEVAGIGFGSALPGVADEAAGMAAAIEQAMRRSLEDAGVAPAAVEVVWAHGNGSVLLDSCEAGAILAVVGETVSVTTIKPTVGETLGAAGAFQAAGAALAIANGVVPGVVGAVPLDVTHPLNLVLNPMVGPVGTILVNTLDRGGSAVSFVLRRSSNG